jgi:palmitoyltransferase ZDHHC13/17
MNSSA